MAMFPVMVGFYWNYSVADVPVNKVDSSSVVQERIVKVLNCVCVCVCVCDCMHAACLSKKSGSGVTSKM